MVKTAQVSGDEDWYKIQLNSPGKLSIQLVKWIGTYDWTTDYDRLYVYNSNSLSIGSAGGYSFYDWMMGSGSPITIHLSAAGKYYMRLHCGSTYSIGGYTCKLTSPNTGINDKSDIPTEYTLQQNYPNPFNPSTTIKYTLPKESNVQLSIYDITGREVRTLVTVNQVVGYKEVLWNGKDNNGSQVSSGIYIFHFKALSLEDGKVFEKNSKLVLLK